MEFKKMRRGEIDRLLIWCRRHDWGKDAVYVNGRIKNLRDHHTDGSLMLVSFDNKADLKAWAGD